MEKIDKLLKEYATFQNIVAENFNKKNQKKHTTSKLKKIREEIDKIKIQLYIERFEKENKKLSIANN
jgi:hypothetical protein